MNKRPQMDKEFLDKIRLQFIHNPGLDSGKLLEFCRKEHLSLQDFSSIMYHLLGDLLCAGKSVEHPVQYNPTQLELGTYVEMEHTDNAMIAEKIAKDHLSEIPDYYTRLQRMEAEALNHA